jgi:zinc protease
MILRNSARIFVALLGIVCFSAVQSPAQQQAVLPDLTFKRLLNELQVTVASTPYLGEGMTIGLSLHYGSAFDPADKSGLANVVARMLGKATTDRNSKDIRDELNNIGANLDVQCDWDGVRLLMRTASPKFERSLLFLYQIVGEAQFNQEDLAATKLEILERMQQPEDPRQRILGQFETSLFRGTTYGRPFLGTKATIDKITVGDVRLYYRTHLSPDAAALTIVGSAPAPLILQKATRIWGVWTRKDEIPFTFLPPRPPSSRNVLLENDPESPAAQFLMGNLWPKREDPAFYPAILAARIFEQRLTKALPTSLLSVNAEGRRLPGPFYIQGQAAADQAVGQIQKVIEVAESLQTSNVTPGELAEAQSKWIDEFNRNLASTDGICSVILDSELYRLGTNYAASFPDLVRRNDADAVKRAAKEWIFPGGMLIIVRGPAATLKGPLEMIGPLQQLTP